MTRVLPWIAAVIVLLFPGPYRRIVGGAPVSRDVFAMDDMTIVGRGHFVHDLPAGNDDGSVNAVIEIPSGTTGKFEVGDDGVMRWARDREHGGPRDVDYLPFPVNYGMVPRTLGDDGDPLDIVVLGRGFERAHVARVRVIGVLAMADDGGRDDKLITVPLEASLQNGFSRLTDLEGLDAGYPELRTIMTLWFSNYWGAGATKVLGWGDASEALQILETAKLRYERARSAPTALPGVAGLRLPAWWPSDARAH
jgi:inorganic pyrophosphatase